jgi:hypothetical protein
LTCFDDKKQNTPHPEGLYLWTAGDSLAEDRPPLFFKRKSHEGAFLAGSEKPSWFIFFFGVAPQ